MKRPIVLFSFPVLLGIAISLFFSTTSTSDPVKSIKAPILVYEEPETPSPEPLTDAISIYSQKLQKIVEEEQIPGVSMAFVYKDKLVDTISVGKADVLKNKELTANTVFRLASLSKGFAPVLAGILVEEGVISWNDKVKDFLPWLELSDSIALEELTIQHVLSHTIGLPRHTYSNLLNMEVPYGEILPRLKEVKLSHPVGTYYNYQNVAYSLIGDVLEAATGQTYEDLLYTYIFGPNVMCEASASYEGLTQAYQLAVPHRNTKSGPQPKTPNDTYYSVLPAAGVNASVLDMGEWLKLLMGYREEIISKETLSEIFEPYIWVSTRESSLRGWRPLDSAWYAMGWRILDYDGRRVVYHGGYVDGYRTEIAFDVDHEVGVVFLSNSPNSLASHAVRDFFDLYWKEVAAREKL